MAMRSLKSHVKRLLRTFHASPASAPATRAATALPTHRRYLGSRPLQADALLQAARDYVRNLVPCGVDYLYMKPFDQGDGSFYYEVYQVLNLLQVMEVPRGGRFLEVGSGPGWVTEILMGLGYEVDALEPCADMIRIATERLAACRQHHRFRDPPRVTCHLGALEDCTLPDESFDAVLFHESLHHVIDEHRGLAQTFRMLRPGGVLGVCEGAWRPGDRLLERVIEEEMARSGTLENPFTRDYLDHLLHLQGFEEVVHYHGINGLFREEMGPMRLEAVAQLPAAESNTLTALKPGCPGHHGPTTADLGAVTRAEVQLLETSLDPVGRRLRLKVRLANRGETAWLHRRRRQGWVNIGLCRGTARRDVGLRSHLPHAVVPGQEVVLDAVYCLPEDYRGEAWYLDIVNEGHFWFSARGTAPAEVRFE